MYLMIDNYDSFVYNLTAYFRELGVDILVKKRDEVSLQLVRRLRPTGIIISPGPGRPGDDARLCELIRQCCHRIPVLGVCLGHQILGNVFGARVAKGQRPMHGKVTPLTHSQSGLFAGLPQHFQVTRYHSLVIKEEGFPSCLSIDARAEDGAIMGISHREACVYGIQFHPEAVLTEYGHELLENFKHICEKWWWNHADCKGA